ARAQAVGSPSRTRTGTPFRAGDFKSPASACSAKGPASLVYIDDRDSRTVKEATRRPGCLPGYRSGREPRSLRGLAAGRGVETRRRAKGCLWAASYRARSTRGEGQGGTRRASRVGARPCWRRVDEAVPYLLVFLGSRPFGVHVDGAGSWHSWHTGDKRIRPTGPRSPGRRQSLDGAGRRSDESERYAGQRPEQSRQRPGQIGR